MKVKNIYVCFCFRDANTCLKVLEQCEVRRNRTGKIGRKKQGGGGVEGVELLGR